MYHSISDEESDRHGYYQTATSPDVFAQHLAHLKENGYQNIRLEELPDRLSDGGHGSKCVALTFDDGYADFFTDAAPLLSDFGFTATMFLPTGYIDDARRSFKGRPCLTWSEVFRLSQMGIEFGSHTDTHPQLHHQPEIAISREISVSKARIEEHLGHEIRSFAYPFAFPQTDRKFVHMLRLALLDAGYQHGVCTAIGLADGSSDPLFLERIPMNGSDDRRFFSAKLSGAYNWMGEAQIIAKRISIGRRLLRHPA